MLIEFRSEKRSRHGEKKTRVFKMERHSEPTWMHLVKLIGIILLAMILLSAGLAPDQMTQLMARIAGL